MSKSEMEENLRSAPTALGAKMNSEAFVRVLIIDDSAAARMKMEELLFAAGYETMSLPSAIGATRTILRNNINVVVADVSMPGLSGDRLVNLLRDNPRLKHLGVIIVTGRDEEELQRIRRETDANAVIAKANLDRLLVSAVEAIVGRPGAGARLGLK